MGRLRAAAWAACRRWKLHWPVILIILAVCLAIAARGVPWAEAWSALQDAKPLWIFAALAVNCSIFPLWASQWWLLAPVAERPRWLRMLDITALVSLSHVFLPALGTQAMAIGLLTFRGGLSSGASTSVVVADLMLTGMARLSVLGVASLVMPSPPWIRDGALSLLGVFAVVVVILFTVVHGTTGIRRYVDRRPGRIARLATKICDGARHLDVLRSRVRMSVGYLYAIGKISCDVLAALAVQHACDITLPPESAILVIAALSLATLLRTPGNLGVYEATVLIIYQSLGVPTATALAASVLQHFVALLPTLSIGLIAFATRRPMLSRPR